MTANKLIGKIKKLCNDNGNQFGFIRPNSPIDNHTGDVRFFPSDMQDIDFDELYTGNIVSFETFIIGSNVVARNISASITGTIIFTKNNQVKQTFWGKIQCDDNNFLEINNHVIFFSGDFVHPITLEEVKLNTRVKFTVQDFQSIIRNIDKKAKSIKIIESKQKKSNTLTSSKSVESVVQSESTIEENIDIFNTQTLKRNLIHLLQKIEIVRDYAEFEDLVFVVLRLLGIHKLYQHRRTDQAGKADGFFIVGNLSVIYDCTLRQDFSGFKVDQIKNYIHQISKDIFTTTKHNNIEYAIKITEYRQVWIITNEINTKRRSRALKNFDDIWIKEVSVQSLIRLFAKRLNSATFEEETLADALRMIDKIDRRKLN